MQEGYIWFKNAATQLSPLPLSTFISTCIGTYSAEYIYPSFYFQYFTIYTKWLQGIIYILMMFLQLHTNIIHFFQRWKGGVGSCSMVERTWWLEPNQCISFQIVCRTPPIECYPTYADTTNVYISGTIIKVFFFCMFFKLFSVLLFNMAGYYATLNCHIHDFMLLNTGSTTRSPDSFSETSPPVPSTTTNPRNSPGIVYSDLQNKYSNVTTKETSGIHLRSTHLPQQSCLPPLPGLYPCGILDKGLI